MSELSQETESKACTPGDQARPRDFASLLALVDSCWPQRALRGKVAGLPSSLVGLLRGPREDHPLLNAAAHLDRALPGWVEIAADVVAQASLRGLGPELQRLCALLARRPLRHPEELLLALGSCPADSRLWLLASVSSTDTASVREAWLSYLRQWVAFEDCEDSPAAWFAFLRAQLGGWLSWEDFRECLLQGHVLSAGANLDGYRPALERLGLWQHPVFAKWYRQVVYEAAHQPDARLTLNAAAWIQDFPGEEYLWSALEDLERRPDSWWPLHVLRWVSMHGTDSASIIAGLRPHTPLVLNLLSLVRDDVCDLVGAALNVPDHREALSWLKTAGPSAALDLNWAANVLQPWVEAIGEQVTLAAGALCATDPPTNFDGPEQPAVRRRAFVRDQILPEFDRLMDNLFCVHALRKSHFPLILEQAQRGTLSAIRALALWPEQAEAAAPALFHLSRAGKKQAKDGANWALHVLRARTGVVDLPHLQRRVDLASAWADSGLEGKPVRAWWDVGGYHVRLSVEAGRVSVAAYSRGRRLASLPAAVRQDPQHQEIRQARHDLAKSYRYFRRRLEQMMADEVRYPGPDFAVLLANPVVRSLASRLVLSVDGDLLRWPTDDPLGDCSPPQHLARAGSIGVAHPFELMQSGRLDQWQQRVIDERISQPFKQVFRETYLPGEPDRDATACVRFAGHPLVARRAFALLRGRGYAPREGDAVKDWPLHQIRAHIEWAHPDEDAGKQLGVRDAKPVTSSGVWFEGEPGGELPLSSVPSVLFSETLRDADLLVSLAAAGEMGFNSEETRRLRATLVRYLARALGLTSIYVSEDDAHAIVDGGRAMYRVHLGSGSVLLEKTRRHLDLGVLRGQPMEALVSESMDTFTARILGIIGALSNDYQITDPQFLDQLQ